MAVGYSNGGYLAGVPATTLALSSPYVAKSFLPYQYSAYPQNLLAYSGYNSLASPYVASPYVASPYASSPYVSAPAYYKYALPSYVQAAPSVLVNPTRTILEPSAVPVVPATAEEPADAREASPEIKENNESEPQGSDENSSQE